jgi:cysteine-rich repeat protein
LKLRFWGCGSSAARLCAALPLLLLACGANTERSEDERGEGNGEPGGSATVVDADHGSTPLASAVPIGTLSGPAAPVPVPGVMVTSNPVGPLAPPLPAPPPPPSPQPDPCAALAVAQRVELSLQNLLLEPAEEYPVCGDSQRERGEICDDGNTFGGCSPATWDGCNNCNAIDPGFVCLRAPCIVVHYCSDFRVTDFETCDDGNAQSGDGCSSTCTREESFDCPTAGEPCVFAERCGDSSITGREECDDGNAEGFDGCSETCLREPGWHCGEPGQTCNVACEDGAVLDLLCDGGYCPEACDAGTCTSGPSGSCAEGPYCGDGLVDPLEECDLGVSNGSGDCTLGCRLSPRCGDGVVQAGEECDLGSSEQGESRNTGTYDTCSPDCMLVPRCSDRITDYAAGEECDDGNRLNNDGCSAVCTFEFDPSAR